MTKLNVGQCASALWSEGKGGVTDETHSESYCRISTFAEVTETATGRIRLWFLPEWYENKASSARDGRQVVRTARGTRVVQRNTSWDCRPCPVKNLTAAVLIRHNCKRQTLETVNERLKLWKRASTRRDVRREAGLPEGLSLGLADQSAYVFADHCRVCWVCDICDSGLEIICRVAAHKRRAVIGHVGSLDYEVIRRVDGFLV